jgi:hypothetical protein
VTIASKSRPRSGPSRRSDLASAVVDFRVWPTSLETLCKTLEAVASCPNVDAHELALFAGLADSTLANASSTLIALGLIRRDQPGIVCTEPVMTRGTSRQVARQLIRKALLSFRPFESMCIGLAIGESSDDAIRKASVVLGVKAGAVPRFQTLIKWGTELELIEEHDGQLRLAREIAPSAIASSMFVDSSDVESEARARRYVASRLGREIFEALDVKERILLAEALLAITVKPAEAVEKAGQAIENYLRELCSARGLREEATKLNGGSQLANLLASRNLIHSHQVKLVDSVSTLRNATAHHKDKKTLKPWEITEDSAIASFFSTLSAIRSIAVYLSRGAQVL